MRTSVILNLKLTMGILQLIYIFKLPLSFMLSELHKVTNHTDSFNIHTKMLQLKTVKLTRLSNHLNMWTKTEIHKSSFLTP